VSPNRYLGCTVPSPPGNNWFSIFPYCTNLVNYENQPFVPPKFTHLFNLIELKIGNNFPFGSKSKFVKEFELKILESELLWNLGQIYWRFKCIWKNLINSLKFSFNLAFHNVNLDWHGCMAKSRVSIQAPFDLV
jgi:hypothetical protein